MIGQNTPRGTMLVVSNPIDTPEKLAAVFRPEHREEVLARISQLPYHEELHEGRRVGLRVIVPSPKLILGWAVVIDGFEGPFPLEAFDIAPELTQ